MKPRFLVLVGAVLALSATAQTTRTESQTPEREKNVGDRLETMIKEFVDNVGKEFGWPESETDQMSDAENTEEENAGPQDKSASSITYDGNKTIEESGVIKANVIVKGGDL